MKSKPKDVLNALTASASNKGRYYFEEPNSANLEKFASPLERHCSIHIEIPEFTSLCPITGQPDYGKIVIDYKPRDYCVESKSLKIYLMGYRQHGAFHEACVERIFMDLYILLKPLWLRVEGQFVPRGGVQIWPVVEREAGK